MSSKSWPGPPLNPNENFSLQRFSLSNEQEVHLLMPPQSQPQTSPSLTQQEPETHTDLLSFAGLACSVPWGFLVLCCGPPVGISSV